MNFEFNLVVGPQAKRFLTELAALVERMEKIVMVPTPVSMPTPVLVEDKSEEKPKEDLQERFDFDAPSEEEKPTSKKKPPSLEDCNEAAMSLCKKTSRANVLAIMEKHFGVKSIVSLKPEQYEAFISALT